LPPPSFTPNSITATLYITVFPTHSYPGFNTSRTLAHAVAKAPKFSHTTPIFKSFHWLKINEHIEYKILFLPYKILTTAQPAYLHNLISVHCSASWLHSFVISHHHRSSTLIFLSQNHRSLILIYIISLWNNLPASFHQPRSSSVTTITPSITSSLFHSRLKTHLFHKSFPPWILSYPPYCPLDSNRTAYRLRTTQHFVLVFFCYLLLVYMFQPEIKVIHSFKPFMSSCHPDLTHTVVSTIA